MRVNSINTAMPLQKACKSRQQQLRNNEAQPQTEVQFKGIKGGAKGGAIGAIAALGVAAVAGPVGIALLPLWTVGGAIAGDTMEDDDKKDKK